MSGWIEVRTEETVPRNDGGEFSGHRGVAVLESGLQILSFCFFHGSSEDVKPHFSNLHSHCLDCTSD